MEHNITHILSLIDSEPKFEVLITFPFILLFIIIECKIFNNWYSWYWWLWHDFTFWKNKWIYCWRKSFWGYFSSLVYWYYYLILIIYWYFYSQKGISRSGTVVIAYFMSRLGYNFYDAADFVCEKRPSNNFLKWKQIFI